MMKFFARDENGRLLGVADSAAGAELIELEHEIKRLHRELDEAKQLSTSPQRADAMWRSIVAQIPPDASGERVVMVEAEQVTGPDFIAVMDRVGELAVSDKDFWSLHRGLSLRFQYRALATNGDKRRRR